MYLNTSVLGVRQTEMSVEIKSCYISCIDNNNCHSPAQAKPNPDWVIPGNAILFNHNLI